MHMCFFVVVNMICVAQDLRAARRKGAKSEGVKSDFEYPSFSIAKTVS